MPVHIHVLVTERCDHWRIHLMERRSLIPVPSSFTLPAALCTARFTKSSTQVTLPHSACVLGLLSILVMSQYLLAKVEDWKRAWDPSGSADRDDGKVPFN